MSFFPRQRLLLQRTARVVVAVQQQQQLVFLAVVVKLVVQPQQQLQALLMVVVVPQPLARLGRQRRARLSLPHGSCGSRQCNRISSSAEDRRREGRRRAVWLGTTPS